MLDVDALFAESTPPDVGRVPRKPREPLSPVNAHAETVPGRPNRHGISGTAFGISSEGNKTANNNLQPVSQVSQGVPCVFARERTSGCEPTREAPAPGAREGRQSENFRAAESDDEAWQADEVERNEAAFMVCCVFNHPNDTEADRQEAFLWALSKRGALDWLKGRHSLFKQDDNRRPCACCANRLASSGRCTAVDRGELSEGC